MREHGLSGHRGGCHCEVCRAANREHVAEWRAGARCCGVHPGCTCPEEVRQRAARPGLSRNDGQVRAGTVNRGQVRGRTGISLIDRASSLVELSDRRSDNVTTLVTTAAGAVDASEPDPWSPGLWELFAEALSIAETGERVKLWPEPDYDIAELADLAESWDQENPGYGLQWEQTSKGLFRKEHALTIWIDTDEPEPEPNPEPEPQPQPRPKLRLAPEPRPAPEPAPVATRTSRQARGVRYQMQANTHGMCEVWTQEESGPCHRYVGGPEEWKHTVNGKPVCPGHYDIVRRDYPERCKYKLMGTWKNAPGV
jgi:hypothetical protein